MPSAQAAASFSSLVLLVSCPAVSLGAFAIARQVFVGSARQHVAPVLAAIVSKTALPGLLWLRALRFFLIGGL